MRTKALRKEHEWTSTLLAFALIPISGFAMDVYIPSFPEMVKDLDTSIASIRFTMSIYIICYGASQLFVGNLVDSFGRYNISIACNIIFILSNIVIVFTDSVALITVMRGLQGVMISIMMVSKRSFFMDVYEGEKVKHYTSLISIVWSLAPIVAPFLGGYLQSIFGWRANFSFLAFYGLVLLCFDLKYGGETLRAPKPFQLKSIAGVYKQFFVARDFMVGIFVLGLSYSTAIVFGMAAPFIIENQFHQTPVVTGYSALASGIALFLGGMLSKRLITRPLYKKIRTANMLQIAVALLMFLTASFYYDLVSMVGFVAILHFLMGFIYNTYFTYCLTKWAGNAGAAGGFTSGGASIVTSLGSYLLVSLVDVHDQRSMAICYIAISVSIGLILFFIPAGLKKEQQRVVSY